MPEHPEAAQTPAPPAASAAEAGKFRRMLWNIRTNSRVAYVIQITSRITTSALALIWIRLLVGVMGKPLNGVFLAFQGVFSLGGLGDLGMGGAIGIRAGRYLGEGKSKETELLKFLASARAVFLILTLIVTGGMLLLSPWLSNWLDFPVVPEAGSLTSVFIVGAFIVGGVLLFSYMSNVNYACGNIAWPVLPDFLLLQVSLLTHWWLARNHQALWVQCLPYLCAGLAKVWLMWFYVRESNPPLSRILPLHFDWAMTISLFEGSFWVYLCTLGNAIYRNTDALVINAGFHAGTLPDYTYNYKFCDLMAFVVITASYVMLPKMTQWMASPDADDQKRLRVQMRRLNQFQTLLGCGAALGYLAFNDLFMKLWWMHKENPILPAALPLQIAFALNLAVTASGDTGLQLALRSGDKGLRVVGILVVVTGLLNLTLSIVAMNMGSLPGIALATVLAQCGLMLGSSFHLCRHLKTPWLPWAWKGCVFPIVGISLAGWLRTLWPLDTPVHVLLLLGSYAVLFVSAALALGVNVTMVRDEITIVRKLLGK